MSEYYSRPTYGTLLGAPEVTAGLLGSGAKYVASDISTAIANALAAAPTTGFVVRVVPGNYTLASRIAFEGASGAGTALSNVHLVLDGSTFTIPAGSLGWQVNGTAVSPSCPMVTARNVSNCRLTGGIYVDASGGTTTYKTVGLSIGDLVVRFTYERMFVQSVQNQAYVYTGYQGGDSGASQYIEGFANRSDSCGTNSASNGGGIRVGYYGTHTLSQVRIHGEVHTNVQAIGCDMSGGQSGAFDDVLVEGCEFQGPTNLATGLMPGIWLEGGNSNAVCTNIRILSNSVYGFQEGILVGAGQVTGPYTGGWRGVTLSGNVVDGANTIGLSISPGNGPLDEWAVNGNILKNTLTGPGIKVTIGGTGTPSMTNWTLFGNHSFDDQSVKTQTYGLVHSIGGTGAATFGPLRYIANDFGGNLTGPFQQAAYTNAAVLSNLVTWDRNVGINGLSGEETVITNFVNANRLTWGFGNGGSATVVSGTAYTVTTDLFLLLTGGSSVTLTTKTSGGTTVLSAITPGSGTTEYLLKAGMTVSVSWVTTAPTFKVRLAS